MEGQAPEEAMQDGIRELLAEHAMQFGGHCKCGIDLRGQWSAWNAHLADLIVQQFPPATLEVTDRQAKIEETLTTLTEWAEGRFGISTEDPARDAVVEAMVTIKHAALLIGLVQLENAGA